MAKASGFVYYENETYLVLTGEQDPLSPSQKRITWTIDINEASLMSSLDLRMLSIRLGRELQGSILLAEETRQISLAVEN